MGACPPVLSVAMTTLVRMKREFDVVVYGATGFVGRLIAEELARSAPEGTSIALAGRDLDKLRATAAELGRPDLECVRADATDAGALRALAERSSVIITTVGPYGKYGEKMVEACAKAGTHYCDLAGEVLFVRESADRWDETARERGATIVHACGFDSVPSDIGVLVAADAARDAGAGELLSTVMHVRDFRGGMSGGTIDSMRVQIDASRSGAKKPGLSTSDPYALSPDRDAEPEPRGRKGQVLLESSSDTGEFAAPFFMGRYNEQIVRRSNALLEWRYGRGFRYREVHDTGRGAVGLAKGAGIAAALPAFAVTLATPGLRQIADRVLPKPGDGPSEHQREQGRFRIEIHAATTSGRRVRVTFADDRDPGYGSTCVMISQAALALAAGEGLRAGVVTPAVGLGEPYAQRLREHGFTIEATVD